MHSASICDAAYCPSPTALAAQGIGRLKGGRVPSFLLTPCLVSLLKREEHFHEGKKYLCCSECACSATGSVS